MKKWFNSETDLKAKKMYYKCKNVENEEYLRVKDYKKELITAQRAYRKKFNHELREMKAPKQYCNIVSDNNTDKEALYS